MRGVRFHSRGGHGFSKGNRGGRFTQAWTNHWGDRFHQQPLPYANFNRFRRKEIFDICKDSQASGSSSKSLHSEPSDCHQSKSIHAEWLPSFISSPNNRSITRPKFLTFPNNIRIRRKQQVCNPTKKQGVDSSRMPWHRSRL